jgi:putative glutamine amidotransferase
MTSLLIGITTTEAVVESMNVCARPVTLINQAYVDLAPSFGATPVLLSCHTPLTSIGRLVAALDAFIIIGGQDIAPEIYQAVPKVAYSAEVNGSGKPFLRPLDYQPSLQRDHFELALYHEAKARHKPIFGICRGLQLINIAEGGSLHQELPEPRTIRHERGDDGFIHHHEIYIDTNSKIYSILERESYVMSSMHHQGIERLGANLHKAAWAEDGLIEIIELIDDNNFIIGVHGHIEQTRTNLKLYDLLLRAFFERAAKAR